MKWTVKLLTTEGNKVRIVLENWGSGLDHIFRRWTLRDGCWQCMDSGEIAQEAGLRGLKVSGARNSASQSSEPLDGGPGPHEGLVGTRGQTMVEYALIIAAVGAVAWGAYNLMGHDIGSMASGIDSSLTST
jgi:Flp pilus assembly pilin Flp